MKYIWGLLAFWIFAVVTACLVLEESLLWVFPAILFFGMYLVFCFFTNNVETDQVGMISLGGEKLDEVGPGYQLVLIPIFNLLTETRRIQYIFSPADHSHTSKSITCTLRQIQFVGKPGTKDHYELAITTIPSLALGVEIEHTMKFFQAVKDHAEAADILCEEINAELLEQCRGKTLRQFIEEMDKIERAITTKIHHSLTVLGLKIVSTSGHATIQITNTGVPGAVAKAETKAMEDLAAIGSASSAAQVDRIRAKGKKALVLAEAADEIALAKAYAEQLGEAGAARVLANRELPKTLEVYIADGKNSPIQPTLPINRQGKNKKGGPTK